jgi:hypothetical protein
VDDGPGWRLGFREIPDRAAADRLREAYLELEVDRDAELGPDAAYWHEVIGTEVRGTGDQVLGRVADVYRVGETEVYTVRDGPVGEFDVPAVRDIIRVFDPRGGRIVVDEAILDLGAAPVPKSSTGVARRRRWSRHGKGARADGSGAGESGTDEGGADEGGADEGRPEPG